MSDSSVARCKYCKKPMNKAEYELFNGYCMKCKEVQDWKQILSEQKKASSKSSSKS